MAFFSEALKLFNLAEELQSSGSGKRGVEASRARLTEETHGRYDFEKMLNDLDSNPYKRKLDHASFIASTTIGLSASSGRGLFASKDFKMGDLVLCEKAFAATWFDVQEDPSHQIDLTPLRLQVERLIEHSPTALNKFFTLTDGVTSPAEHGGCALP